jgi:hypothetical protein
MKLKNLVFVAVFLSVLLPSFVFAEDAAEEWVRRYGGVVAGYTNMEMDSSGNIYVAASLYNSNWETDYVTVKYDTKGNELWVRKYDGGYDDRSIAIAVDPSGNVYVTGWGGSGFWWIIRLCHSKIRYQWQCSVG